MTYDIVIDGPKAVINVSFADEGVDLVGETQIRGDQAAAEQYVTVFEADLRRNYADRFPQPDLPIEPDMGGIE